VALMVLKLQRDGFNWLVVALLVMAAGVCGARLATFPGRAETAEASARG